jgi:hypothetical protein
MIPQQSLLRIIAMCSRRELEGEIPLYYSARLARKLFLVVSSGEKPKPKINNRWQREAENNPALFFRQIERRTQARNRRAVYYEVPVGVDSRPQTLKSIERDRDIKRSGPTNVAS